MKKKLNPFGKEGKLLLCNSCGPYRHFVAKCPDSWENMVKREDNVGNVNSAGQSNTEKIRGNKELSGEAESHIGERCNAPNAVVVEELAVEVTSLKREIRSLKDEITEIKTDRDEELKRRKKKLHSHVKNLEEVKERHEKQTRVIAKELDERVLGHFGHGHFGHGRFGQDISATDILATDISANGHFGHGRFSHGKNTYFLLLQMEFNRLLPFKINMFDHYNLTQ